MRQFLLAITCGVLLSCNVQPENTVDAVSYFNIEELLNKEIQYLVGQQAGLEKTLNSNGQSETTHMEPQTKEEWDSQLSLFFEANIDKPGLREAYHEEGLSTLEGMSTKIYSAKSAKSFVQTLELLYNNEVLKQINIQTSEKNEVYTSGRNLKLFLDNEGQHIVGFDVSGDEKMRMKEAMNFEVKAVITY